VTNYYQWLVIDLRKVKKITAIGTLGLKDSPSYVMEYAIQSSLDGDNWQGAATPAASSDLSGMSAEVGQLLSCSCSFSAGGGGGGEWSDGDKVLKSLVCV
jgi:hypothetical protein